jgi:hypothetical protein
VVVDTPSVESCLVPAAWRWVYDWDVDEFVDRSRVPVHPQGTWDADLGALAVALLVVPAVDAAASLPCGRWSGHELEYLVEAPPPSATDVTPLAIDLLAGAWTTRDMLAEAVADDRGFELLVLAALAGSPGAAALAEELRGPGWRGGLGVEDE